MKLLLILISFLIVCASTQPVSNPNQLKRRHRPIFKFQPFTNETTTTTAATTTAAQVQAAIVEEFSEQCPKLIQNKPCENECSSDQDCSRDFICCLHSCGSACVDLNAPKEKAKKTLKQIEEPKRVVKEDEYENENEYENDIDEVEEKSPPKKAEKEQKEEVEEEQFEEPKEPKQIRKSQKPSEKKEIRRKPSENRNRNNRVEEPLQPKKAFSRPNRNRQRNHEEDYEDYGNPLLKMQYGMGQDYGMGTMGQMGGMGLGAMNAMAMGGMGPMAPMGGYGNMNPYASMTGYGGPSGFSNMAGYVPVNSMGLLDEMTTPPSPLFPRFNLKGDGRGKKVRKLNAKMPNQQAKKLNFRGIYDVMKE